MIRSFRHKGLRQLFEDGDRRRVQAAQVDKIERILAVLDRITEPADMALPGFRLHPLKGELVGAWAVSVSGNWRIVFRMVDGHAVDVDLLDYH